MYISRYIGRGVSPIPGKVVGFLDKSVCTSERGGKQQPLVTRQEIEISKQKRCHNIFTLGCLHMVSLYPKGMSRITENTSKINNVQQLTHKQRKGKRKERKKKPTHQKVTDLFDIKQIGKGTSSCKPNKDPKRYMSRRFL